MKSGRKTAAGYVAVLLACILFLGWLRIGYYHPDARLNFGSTHTLEMELRQEGESPVYSAVLPDGFDEGRSLLFKSAHAAVEVSLDGETLYTYGAERHIAGKSPGTYWHVVSLPAESAGRELSIRLLPAYGASGGLDGAVRYGGRGDCILALVSSFLPVLVINFTIIMMGLVCLLLFAMMTVRKRVRREKIGFLYMGLFSLTIAVWSLRQCGFLQFLLPDGQILYFVDLLLLFLVLPPLDLFLYEISATKWGKGYLWITAAHLAEAVLGTVLQLAGIIDIFEMLICLHALILLNGIYMFWSIHREIVARKDSAIGRIRVPLNTLIVFGGLELVTYYYPVFGGISVFLPLGAMVFILMLIWQEIERHYQSLLEEQKLVYYKTLANTDMLTGASSRNAYEDELKQLTSEGAGARGYGAVLFDVNDLKIINDNYGHEQGDTAIKLCYDSILEAFGDCGKCYRIGGDEFVFLVFEGAEIESRIAAFDELVAKNGAAVDFPFNVALGYAAFDASRDESFQDTVKRSDAMMYQNKMRKKQNPQAFGGGAAERTN